MLREGCSGVGINNDGEHMRVTVLGDIHALVCLESPQGSR